jgi:hypothetical protein
VHFVFLLLVPNLSFQASEQVVTNFEQCKKGELDPKNLIQGDESELGIGCCPHLANLVVQGALKDIPIVWSAISKARDRAHHVFY